MGRGKGNFLEKVSLFPSPNPSPFPSKTFALIESLAASFPVCGGSFAVCRIFWGRWDGRERWRECRGRLDDGTKGEDGPEPPHHEASLGRKVGEMLSDETSPRRERFQSMGPPRPLKSLSFRAMSAFAPFSNSEHKESHHERYKHHAAPFVPRAGRRRPCRARPPQHRHRPAHCAGRLPVGQHADAGIPDRIRH